MLKFKSLTRFIPKQSSLITSRRVLASAHLNIFSQRSYFSSSIEFDPVFDEKFELQSYIGIANEFIKNDNANGALENYRKALAILQKISLENIFSPTDALTMAEIHVKKGSIFFSNGELNDALRNFVRARELFESHKDQEVMLAECDDNIGSIHYELGNHTESLNSFQKVVDVYNAAPADLSLAKVLYKMSLVYTALGKTDQAIDNLDQCVKIRQDLGLMNEEETVDVLIVLGEAFINNQQYAEAIDTYNQALEIQKSFSESNSRNLISCYSNIATAYNLSSVPDKALEYFAKSLDLKRKAFGKSSAELIEDYVNIADIYCDKGEYQDALSLYKSALKIAKSKKANDNMAYIYYKLAAIYRETRYLKEAVEHLETGIKAFSKATKAGKSARPHLYEMYEMLASVYFDLKNYDKAKQCYHQALFCCSSTAGSMSKQAFQLHLAVGSLHFFLKDWTGALESYEVALQNQIQALGKEHYSVGYIYHGLANVHTKQWRFGEAVEYFKKSLELLEKELDSKNIYFANFYTDYAIALYDNGNLEEAILKLKKGLDVVIDNYGIAHPDIIDFFKDLKCLYKKKGDHEEIYKLQRFLRI